MIETLTKIDPLLLAVGFTVFAGAAMSAGAVTFGWIRHQRDLRISLVEAKAEFRRLYSKRGVRTAMENWTLAEQAKLVALLEGGRK